MRLSSIIALMAVFVALPAAATDTSSSKERSNSSSSSTSSSASSTDNSGLSLNGGGISNIGGTSTDSDFGLLRQLSGKHSKKWWEVGLAYEFHRLFIQNDLEGAAAEKLFFYYSAYAQADLTAYDRISIRAGFAEYLLADPGETGVRASDIDFVYSHRIPLPWKLSLRLTGYLTAPTSYSSYLASSITTPSVSVTLSRKFGDFSVDLRALAHYYWTKYATEAGGNPNPQVSWGGEVQLEYDLPFFRSLTVGADIYTEYYVDYGVYPNNDPYILSQGLTVPSYAATQPIEQSYGGEAYLRYTLPKFAGFSADITAAYATGDPSEGYPNILHDGVQEIYAFWRESSEFYFIVSLSY